MQETEDLNGTLHREFFSAQSEVEVAQKMRDRLHHLKGQGHTFVRQVRIGRNDPCPCGSGMKFKKCCINKVVSNAL